MKAQTCTRTDPHAFGPCNGYARPDCRTSDSLSDIKELETDEFTVWYKNNSKYGLRIPKWREGFIGPTSEPYTLTDHPVMPFQYYTEKIKVPKLVADGTFDEMFAARTVALKKMLETSWRNEQEHIIKTMLGDPPPGGWPKPKPRTTAQKLCDIVKKFARKRLCRPRWWKLRWGDTCECY